MFDAITVSSDSQKIINVGQEWWANYLIFCINELVSDYAGKLNMIKQCVHEVEKEL